MIGNRIRMLRQANCLSLQQLAERLTANGFPITKAALFKYEAGKTVPNEQCLQALAYAMGVRQTFFLRDDWEDFSLELPEELGGVSARQHEILSYIQIELERFISVSDRIGHKLLSTPVPSYEVSFSQPDSIERAAESLRQDWNIGRNAISSVCDLLESNGWVLFSLPEVFSWDCISGLERSHQVRFLFFTNISFLDEVRSKLLTELGRHILVYDPVEKADVLSHFARAVLFPRDCVTREFGSHRTILHSDEMDCIKRKYGLPRHDILTRLSECGVISDEYYEGYQLRVRQSHHLLRETTPHALLNFFEEPSIVHMHIRHARAEGIIPAEFGHSFDY